MKTGIVWTKVAIFAHSFLSANCMFANSFDYLYNFGFIGSKANSFKCMILFSERVSGTLSKGVSGQTEAKND